MLSIILDHLQWFPNGFDWVSLRGSLFVSAAEGFFLISGIILGIIRGDKLRDRPFREGALLVLKRGIKLYAVGVLLMLAFTLIGWFFLGNPGLKPGIRPLEQPFNEVLFGALSLQYLYGWADFLRLYAIFLIMSPFALWLLRNGKWWIVLIASAALWSLYPLALSHDLKSAELLMPLSWQFIFFAGLIIGFHYRTIANWWQSLRAHTRRWILAPLLAVAVTTLVANIVFSLLVTWNILPAGGSELYAALSRTAFNKEALTIPRLILFALWFLLGFTIFSVYEQHIKKLFGWILLPFGQNSLYVYILHAIIIFFAHLIMKPEATSSFAINFCGTVIVLGIILLAVRRKFLFKIIPR